MKIVTNQKIIKRNSRIGQVSTLVSLAILAGGLFMSFNPDLIQYSFFALLAGFVLSQVGIHYGTKFGRSPRPDERLSMALKGLGDQYVLYHYAGPVPHLLIGPAGILPLLPYNQRGTITYDEGKKRWRQKGGNLYLKIFAQEGLGRPDLDVEVHLQDINNHVKKNLSDTKLPPLKPVLVFTNDKVDIQANNAPAPTLPAEKLKDYVRRLAKEEPAPMEQIRLFQKTLPADSIEAK
jgi:hypothetical protein